MSIASTPAHRVPEGAKVSYVGWSQRDEAGLAIGDEGRVISAAKNASHVRWLGGDRRGQITLTANADLVVTENEDPISALANGGASFRKICAQAGVEGVLATLESKGYLGALTLIAKEVDDIVSARVRAIPALSAAYDQLAPDAAEALVELAKAAVLQEL